MPRFGYFLASEERPPGALVMRAKRGKPFAGSRPPARCRCEAMHLLPLPRHFTEFYASHVLPHAREAAP